MGIKYGALVEHFKREPKQAAGWLTESLKKKEVRPDDFDFGRLFEEIFGWEEFRAVRSDRSRLITKDVYEAAGAVSSNMFANITGQIVYNAFLEGYESPQFVFKAMIPEVRTTFIYGERVAGVTEVGDEAQTIKEGDPYPLVGVSEDWIDTPPLVKRGFILPVTREAVIAERTGQLLDRCRSSGNWMGYNDELRAIDCVIDENAGAVSKVLGGHRYHRRDNSIATYGDSSGTHDFDNLQATNALVDYSDLENVELLFTAMADPGTGIIDGRYRAAADTLIVPDSLIHTARQILSATEIRVHAGGYPTSGNLPERASPSSLQSYNLVTSPLLTFRMATKTSWYAGNPRRAYRKMVAWPLENTTAPANSHEEFTRDIVAQYKSSQMDAYTTFDPRFMVKSTVA
jgi:hypothetical protein